MLQTASAQDQLREGEHVSDDESRSRGATLKRAREAVGLSAEEMADRVQVATSTYSGWEQGRHQPRGRTAARLATVLDALSSERASAGRPISRIRMTGTPQRTTPELPFATPTQDDMIVFVRPPGISDEDWSRIREGERDRHAWLRMLAQQAATARDAVPAPRHPDAVLVAGSEQGRKGGHAYGPGHARFDDGEACAQALRAVSVVPGGQVAGLPQVGRVDEPLAQCHGFGAQPLRVGCCAICGEDVDGVGSAEHG